jgi:hypothetical protein
MEYVPTLGEFIEKNKPLPKEYEVIYSFPSGDNGCERQRLREEFKQRVDDILISHRYVVAIYNSNQEVFGPAFDAYNRNYNGMFDDILDDDGKVVEARIGFRMFNHHMEQQRAIQIANEGLIIHLWATIEQYTKRAYLIVCDGSETKKPSYQWPVIKEILAGKGIDLETLLAYSGIDEMRVLNNKIKHTYMVDETLAAFAPFKDYLNQRIDKAPLRIDEYAISTYLFIYNLISLLGENEQY